MSNSGLHHKVWAGSIPIEIHLSSEDCRTYDQSLAYFIQYPRLSYLPFILPRLRSFFAPALIDATAPTHQGWFSYDGVPLKWQYPVGLLYDLFSGTEPASPDKLEKGLHRSDNFDNRIQTDRSCPWKLTLHFSDWPADQLIRLDADGKVHHDAFINSVKEADFLRNGTGKIMMSLSKDDSTKLWQSVQNHDLALFTSINYKLLNPTDNAWIRHVPIKVYLPVAASRPTADHDSIGEQARGSLKVVQALVAPMLSTSEPQTLGSTLRNMLPSVFPSRRAYIHAQAVLHGAVLPLSSPVQELMHNAAYADGFLHITIQMVC